MAVLALAVRAGRSIQFRLDKFLAEPRNRWLEQLYRRDREQWLRTIDVAVDRGLDWFRPQAELTMSALHVLYQVRRRTGDRRINFLDAKIKRYRETTRDPELRLVDPYYDPIEHRHLPERRPSKMDILMTDAIWAAHRNPLALVETLRGCSDQGGYGSTHIVIGGLAMKLAGETLSGQVDRMMAEEVPVIAKANRATSYAGDLYAERIVVLQWLDRHDLVSPAWILRILRAQRADGGWSARNIPPFGRSNQHTTCLAIGALAQFAHNERGL
jgi:hypothetical protein